ncbi:unnamed protein product, partial [Allacma fusca]
NRNRRVLFLLRGNSIGSSGQVDQGIKTFTQPKITESLVRTSDQEQQIIQLAIKFTILDQTVGICTTRDGWSNIHNCPILTHAVICGQKAFLIDSKDCEDSKKDHKFLAGEMERVCCRILAIHMFNLLCHDVIPAETRADVNRVNKTFRSKTKLKARLKRLGGVMPQLPNDTRWISNFALLDTFVLNRPKYLQLLEESIDNKEKLVSPEVQRILNSADIITEAKEIRIRLKTIVEFLEMLERDSVNVADALHAWISLREDPVFINYRSSIVTRMKTSVKDFVYVAYAFHPLYQGKGLRPDEYKVVEKYLQEKDPSTTFRRIYESFFDKSPEIFSAERFDIEFVSKSNRGTWWNCMRKYGTVPTELIEMLSKLHKCPPGTAANIFTFCNDPNENEKPAGKNVWIMQVEEVADFEEFYDGEDMPESDDEILSDKYLDIRLIKFYPSHYSPL